MTGKSVKKEHYVQRPYPLRRSSKEMFHTGSKQQHSNMEKLFGGAKSSRTPYDLHWLKYYNNHSKDTKYDLPISLGKS